MKRTLAAIVLTVVCAAAQGADDRFQKDGPNSMGGFMPATDPLYVKECGSCHFPYSPGLLPARSWQLYATRLDRHFGEALSLKPETREAILKYLVDNAADRSAHEGSQTFMERIDPRQTPYRLWQVPLYREMHRVIVEVIDRKPKIRVRKLTNCDGCHRRAAEGSFGHQEMWVPGLTISREVPDAFK